MTDAHAEPAEQLSRDLAEELTAKLNAAGQSHVLRFIDELDDDDARMSFLQSLKGIDLEQVQSLFRGEGIVGDAVDATDSAPAPVDVIRPGGLGADLARYRSIGNKLIRGGKVAAFTVAGGQGTRLGWNGPKGTYPASVVTGKPLFRLFAEQLLRAIQDAGTPIAWYIMTSPLNDEATRAFFLDNNCFGLDRTAIFMFPQGVMPSVDAKTGKLLLADKDSLAVNPDGHGGAFRALRASGALEDMRMRGVTHISYFQVDNPVVRVMDPLFLGLHAEHPASSGEMSSKVVAKQDPAEKVGVFARVGDDTTILEYSDLPAALAEQRDADGTLSFDAGNIAVHALSVDFVEKLTEAGGGLPFHRAHKKVPHLDPETGARVEPTEPNAIKFETFAFDALPMATSPLVVETDRVEEFAPIKNASGSDSPESSRALQSERAGRWLEANGVTVPRTSAGDVDAAIEISPLTAVEAGQLNGQTLPADIEPGSEIVL